MEELEYLIRRCNKIDTEGGVAYILCANLETARFIKDEARKLNVDIRYPITFGEYIHGGVGIFITHIFVYDSEYILRQFLEPHRRNAMVMTYETCKKLDEMTGSENK